MTFIDPRGTTRSRVTTQYALLTRDTFVWSSLPGWTNTKIAVHIAPALGAGFLQYTALLEAGATAGMPGSGNQRLIYVESGEVVVAIGGETHALTSGGFAYLPAGVEHAIEANAAARLTVFEKPYALSTTHGSPAPIIGQEQDITGSPFMGDDAAILKLLLPDAPEFDMAVNVFTYQPGANLPQVEIHVMEHGLLMLDGAGVYRLADDWFPVEQGDVIWMAPFCPQWFVAMGKSPARYLYYKDVNRDPLT